jgi:hypothetical protein
MSVLVATPGATNANAYATVARINRILGLRPHAASWFTSGSTPDAETYLVNQPTPPSLGATSIAVDGGTGTWTAGCQFTIAGDTTVYTVATALTGSGTLTFSPGLVVVPANNAEIERVTANEREKVIIFGSSLFDSLLSFEGSKASSAQRMRLPRTGLRDADGFPLASNTIPEIVELALAEFVLILQRRDKFQPPAVLGQGVSEVQLGQLKAKVDSSAVEDVIPQNILAMLSEIADLEPEASTGAAVFMLGRS